MKNIIRFVIIALIISVFTNNSLAQQNEEENYDKVVIKHGFEIAPVIASFEYKEPSVMTKEGLLYGILGRYTYYDKKVTCIASIEYTFGDLDYDGDSWGGTPAKSDTRDWILELRTLAGRNIHIDEYLIIPFIGIGCRFWNNVTHGTGFYEREILYCYSPIGVNTVIPLSNNWTWSINAEYDLFLAGIVKSHLSDVDSGYNNPEVSRNFGDGYGLRFSFQIKYNLTNNFALSIEPYINYWDINKSEKETLTFNGSPYSYVWEPENTTTTYGLRIVFVF